MRIATSGFSRFPSQRLGSFATLPPEISYPFSCARFRPDALVNIPHRSFLTKDTLLRFFKNVPRSEAFEKLATGFDTDLVNTSVFGEWREYYERGTRVALTDSDVRVGNFDPSLPVEAHLSIRRVGKDYFPDPDESLKSWVTPDKDGEKFATEWISVFDSEKTGTHWPALKLPEFYHLVERLSPCVHTLSILENHSGVIFDSYQYENSNPELLAADISVAVDIYNLVKGLGSSYPTEDAH